MRDEHIDRLLGLIEERKWQEAITLTALIRQGDRAENVCQGITLAGRQCRRRGTAIWADKWYCGAHIWEARRGN